MAAAMPFLMAAGTVVNAFGQYASGQAQAAAAQYNANMAAQNAEIQKQNAVMAGQAGAQRAAMQSLHTRTAIGQTQANQGASGISLNQGSAADVVQSEKQIGLLDAINVRNEATKRAYGYEVQSVNDIAQSKLDRYQASTAKEMSYLNAAGTLLTGSAQTYGAYQRLQQAGALDSGTGGIGNYTGDGNGEW